MAFESHELFKEQASTGVSKPVGLRDAGKGKLFITAADGANLTLEIQAPDPVTGARHCLAEEIITADGNITYEWDGGWPHLFAEVTAYTSGNVSVGVVSYDGRQN